LALIDESGFLMTPLLRRSWAPQGKPPLLRPKSGHRDKVSVAAALWLTPQRDRLGLFSRVLVNDYFNNERVAPFVRALLQEISCPLIVIWDGGTMHKGDPIRQLVKECKGRLMLERLPSYGAELMPVEQLWAWLKYDRLPNFVPQNAQQLNTEVQNALAVAREDQQRLKNFFHASKLSLPRTLLL
jgi:transposase